MEEYPLASGYRYAGGLHAILNPRSTAVAFPPMRFYQLWHERVHQAPEHKWLRDQVSAAAKAL